MTDLVPVDTDKAEVLNFVDPFFMNLQRISNTPVFSWRIQRSAGTTSRKWQLNWGYLRHLDLYDSLTSNGMNPRMLKPALMSLWSSFLSFFRSVELWSRSQIVRELIELTTLLISTDLADLVLMENFIWRSESLLYSSGIILIINLFHGGRHYITLLSFNPPFCIYQLVTIALLFQKSFNVFWIYCKIHEKKRPNYVMWPFNAVFFLIMTFIVVFFWCVLKMINIFLWMICKWRIKN